MFAAGAPAAGATIPRRRTRSESAGSHHFYCLRCSTYCPRLNPRLFFNKRSKCADLIRPDSIRRGKVFFVNRRLTNSITTRDIFRCTCTTRRHAIAGWLEPRVSPGICTGLSPAHPSPSIVEKPRFPDWPLPPADGPVVLSHAHRTLLTAALGIRI